MFVMATRHIVECVVIDVIGVFATNFVYTHTHTHKSLWEDEIYITLSYIFP